MAAIAPNSMANNPAAIALRRIRPMRTICAPMGQSPDQHSSVVTLIVADAQATLVPSQQSFGFALAHGRQVVYVLLTAHAEVDAFALDCLHVVPRRAARTGDANALQQGNGRQRRISTLAELLL